MKLRLGLILCLVSIVTAQTNAQLIPQDTFVEASGAVAMPLERSIAADKLQMLDAAGIEPLWPNSYRLDVEHDVTVSAFTEPSGATLLVYNFQPWNQDVFVRVTNGGTADAELRIWSDGPSEIVVHNNEIQLVEVPSADTIRFRIATDGLSALDAIACIARHLGATISPSFLSDYLSSRACSATSSIALALTAYNCLSIPAPMAIVGCVNGIARLISCSFVSCAKCSITSTSVGRNESGSWSSTCRSQQRSSSYARFYSFKLSQRQKVDITVTSSNADPVIYLLRGKETTSPVVTSNDDGAGGVNARITRTLDAGTYVVEVVSKGTDRAGSFKLSLR